MIEVHAATGVGGLLRYLRAHAEATAYDARQSPELRAELLGRCFASPGFRYVKDPRGTDRWYNFTAALHHLQCRPATGSPPQLCADCEDLAAYFAAAALATDCYAWIEVGIVPPPGPGQDGHAIGRAGPLIAPPPAGLVLPEAGIWDASVWCGMGPPDPRLYSTAAFLRLRSD